jgi:hypothetical protein
MEEGSSTVADVLDLAFGRAGVKGAGDAALAHGVGCHCGGYRGLMRSRCVDISMRESWNCETSRSAFESLIFLENINH